MLLIKSCKFILKEVKFKIHWFFYWRRSVPPFDYTSVFTKLFKDQNLNKNPGNSCDHRQDQRWWGIRSRWSRLEVCRHGSWSTLSILFLRLHRGCHNFCFSCGSSHSCLLIRDERFLSFWFFCKNKSKCRFTIQCTLKSFYLL